MLVPFTCRCSMAIALVTKTAALRPGLDQAGRDWPEAMSPQEDAPFSHYKFPDGGRGRERALRGSEHEGDGSHAPFDWTEQALGFLFRLTTGVGFVPNRELVSWLPKATRRV